MTDSLRKLIEALRDELQQYGELLALLDQQQELVVSRAADGLLQTVAAINEQNTIIQSARQERERRRRDLAIELMREAETPFAELVPLLPAEYQPLVAALVDENNHLLRRIQQRGRQNHLLLHHSLQLMQHFLDNVIAPIPAPTYSGAGTLVSPGLANRSLYDAVG